MGCDLKVANDEFFYNSHGSAQFRRSDSEGWISKRTKKFSFLFYIAADSYIGIIIHNNGSPSLPKMTVLYLIELRPILNRLSCGQSDLLWICSYLKLTIVALETA